MKSRRKSVRASARPLSAATERATAFVAEMLPRAIGLGRALADEAGDPEAFAQALANAFDALADPIYGAEQDPAAFKASATDFLNASPLLLASAADKPLDE